MSTINGEFKNESLPKQTQRQKALERLKNHYGVRNRPQNRSEIPPPKSETRGKELELQDYVRGVAASFKTPIQPNLTEKIAQYLFDSSDLITKLSIQQTTHLTQSEDRARDHNLLERDIPVMTNRTETQDGNKLVQKEVTPLHRLYPAQQVLDPFEKVDKMKEINEHLSIFANTSLLGIKPEQGHPTFKSEKPKSNEISNAAAKELEQNAEVENPEKAPKVDEEERNLTNKSFPESIVENKEMSVFEEIAIDSIVSLGNDKKAIEAEEIPTNIIDSIIDEGDESEEGAVEKEDLLPVDNMIESESEPGDKTRESESEPVMKVDLVGKISETWEDIVVRRVTKQMQMK